MSKTAVLISGEMRSFDRCLASQYWQVFRKLEDPHFFLCIAKDAQDTSAFLLEQFPEFEGKIFVDVREQPNLPEPNKRYAAHAPYAISSPIQAILRQLWFYSQVWCLFAKTVGDAQKEFTSFIRFRPDTFWHSFEPIEPAPHEFLGHWKAKCGGVNDRFAIMGPKAAEAYFNAFYRLQVLLDRGCPLHPESIQKAALEEAGALISNVLTCEFHVLRLNGEKVPLLEYQGELAQYLSAFMRYTPHLDLDRIIPGVTGHD